VAAVGWKVYLREVYLRDQGRCTSISRAGRHGRTRRLEFPRRVPFAECGASTAASVGLLRTMHNRWEAARWYGEDLDQSNRRPRR